MTIKTKILIFSISFLILFPVSERNLIAQVYTQKSDWSFGIFSNILIPKYKLDFRQLPGVPNCCPNFDNGDGTGLDAGLMAEYRIFAYNQIRLKTGISIFSGFISAIEPEWVVVNEKLYPASISHEIVSSFTFVTIEPSYKYSTPIGLSFLAGIAAGINLSSHYRQKEILTKPENEGTFENGKRIRNETSGKINNTSVLMISPFIGAEYSFPLDKYSNFVISPSFAFYYGINSFLRSEDWNYMYFSIGLNLKYVPFREVSSPLEPKK